MGLYLGGLIFGGGLIFFLGGGAYYRNFTVYDSHLNYWKKTWRRESDVVNPSLNLPWPARHRHLKLHMTVIADKFANTCPHSLRRKRFRRTFCSIKDFSSFWLGEGLGASKKIDNFLLSLNFSRRKPYGNACGSGAKPRARVSQSTPLPPSPPPPPSPPGTHTNTHPNPQIKNKQKIIHPERAELKLCTLKK